MRLIDADTLPVKFDGHTVSVWKNDLDAAPTINPYEWISIEDRLPSKSENVLSYSALGIAICNYSAKHKLFNAYDNNTIEDAKTYCLDTTHWMPLPEPPTEKEN